MRSSEGADAIIVGAGSAGCVLARRLAERGDRRVLLLEAGPAAEETDQARDGWHIAKVPDWGLTNAADGSTLRRGRVVGGSSWFTRFAVRGHRADFDQWATLGITGWTFDDLLPWFRKLESDTEGGDDPWHGATGPLPITRYPGMARTRIHEAAAEALAAVGIPPITDHNAPDAVGVGPMPMSTLEGRRVTTFDGWLRDVDLPTLELRTDSPVDNVLLDGGNVSGIRLVDGTTVRSDRVILCAGTYGSPAILLRSGIGDPDELRALGVEPVVALPGVGRNLADHPAIDLDTGYAGAEPVEPSLHSLATFRSSLADPDGAPDLLFWLTDPGSDDPHFYLDPILLKPASRGRVRLQSADPGAAPVIELAPPSEPADLARLAEGHALALEAMATEPLASLLPTPRPRTADAAPAETYSLPHVVGTCRMGPDPAAGGVVEDRCDVHGVRGLSVVDASVIPEPTAGFPHVIVIAIAERVAAWELAGGD